MKHTLINSKVVFERFDYPAGETHIRVKYKPKKHEVVLFECYGWDDFMDMLVGVQALESLRCLPNVCVPYLPFGRHDRSMVVGDGMPLELLKRFITYHFQGLNLLTIDPHSEVSTTNPHLPHVKQGDIVKQAGLPEGALYAVPDAGAWGKASKWLYGGQTARPFIQCSKQRDSETGRLSGFVVNALPKELKGYEDVVIVDDICDGGGTFVGLAKKLKKLGANRIHLCVTHGLFTKGVTELLGLFDTIYTLDVYKERVPVTHRPRLRFIDTAKIIGDFFDD